MPSGAARYSTAVLAKYDGPTGQVSFEVANALAAQREHATVELQNQLDTVPGETVLGTDLGGEASAVLEPGRVYNLPQELAERLIDSSFWWSRVHDYEKLTKAALLDLAAERDIEGRSEMSKAQLVEALRSTPTPPPPEVDAEQQGGGGPTAPTGTTAPAAATGAPVPAAEGGTT